MEWVETTGRTIEEAKDAALDQLGVDESDAEFVVLAEPRPGLFGRLRGEARVRARVRPTSPRPKRGRRRPSQEQRRGGSRQPRNSGAPSGRSAVAVAEPSSDGDGAQDAEPAATSRNGARSDEAQQGRQRTEGAPARSRNRRRRSGRAGGQPAARDVSPAGSEVEHTEEGEVPMSLSLEEQGESARQFVAGLLEELGLEAEVAVRTVDETTAEVAVSGSGLGMLIGPGGATLGAVQELTRTIVQKRTGGHSDRILVDVAGYRAKRAEALQRFTQQVASEVLSSGSEQALEPMSAADRKVVHDTVNELAGVQTRSEGEDPRRYIVISPSAGQAPDEPQESDDAD